MRELKAEDGSARMLRCRSKPAVHAKTGAMSYDNLILSLDGRVATLTVNRPDVRNALDSATVDEMHRALEEVRTAGASVLILTGAGDKAFVSGADIRAIRQRRRDDALASVNSRLMSAVESHQAVSIAAVNGYALGGGCELALACDLRIAAESAVFGLPEPSLGIIPGAGATQRLPRVVGLGRAKEMILTGARWDARKALEFGLVSEVVPAGQLMSAARAMADRILALGPLAVRLAKMALNASSQAPLAAGLVYESTAQAITFESRDKMEGTAAFLEKRKPRFEGE
jgi:enoyl-CoA hydratase